MSIRPDHLPDPARYLPVIDKSLPRPAPTREYSYSEFSPDAVVYYIRNHEEANYFLSELPKDTHVLGFDLEWKPTFVRGGQENPVALVQLACDSAIYLLQITSMKEFPSSLQQLLANPRIVKTGVAIQSDARKLYNDYRVPITNCVDLSLLARTVDNARWQGSYNASLGLARLVESYLYRLLGKGKVTRSNWEAKLSQLQREYAANDAHAGFLIYQRLSRLKAAMPVQPDPAYYTFSYAAGHLQDAQGNPWHPHNPNYDPGPPPTPRPPRDGDDTHAHAHANSNANDGGYRPPRRGRRREQLNGRTVPPGGFTKQILLSAMAADLSGVPSPTAAPQYPPPEREVPIPAWGAAEWYAEQRAAEQGQAFPAAPQAHEQQQQWYSTDGGQGQGYGDGNNGYGDGTGWDAPRGAEPSYYDRPYDPATMYNALPGPSSVPYGSPPDPWADSVPAYDPRDPRPILEPPRTAAPQRAQWSTHARGGGGGPSRAARPPRR